MISNTSRIRQSSRWALAIAVVILSISGCTGSATTVEYSGSLEGIVGACATLAIQNGYQTSVDTPSSIRVNKIGVETTHLKDRTVHDVVGRLIWMESGRVSHFRWSCTAEVEIGSRGMNVDLIDFESEK